MTSHSFTVDVPETLRLDRYLAEHEHLMTRSQLKERLTDITVNGKKAKLSAGVSSGDIIRLQLSDPPLPGYGPEFLPLDIIFENDDVIVVNKARGVVVHPAAGNHSGTLVQGLMYHIRGLTESFAGEPVRPGIVHRLDKDTTGVLIAAKHPEALEFLARQFRKKKVRKSYLALVKGQLIPSEGTIENRLVRNPGNRKKFTWSETEGKEAITRYKVLRQYRDSAFVMLKPETGRTHQLRVHMLSRGNPIIGDPLYARKSEPGIPDLMLHAYQLVIRLPGRQNTSVFQAAVPEDFKKAIMLKAEEV